MTIGKQDETVYAGAAQQCAKGARGHAAGTNEVNLLLVGRELTGLNAFV